MQLSTTSPKGASLIEVALSLPVFISVLFIGLELLLMGFTSLRLQYGIDAGARYAALGHIENTCGINQNQPCTREESIRQQIQAASGIQIPAGTLAICPMQSTDVHCSSGTVDAGISGYDVWINLTVRYPYRVSFGSYDVELNLSALVKNEIQFTP